MQNSLGIILWFMAFHACAWNAMGHQLMAQIAYDKLTPKAKHSCDQWLFKSAYSRKGAQPCQPKLILSSRISLHSGIGVSSHRSHCPKQSKYQYMIPFVFASTWMDVIKYKNNHRLDALHYLDIPYSQDGSPLPALASPNAFTAIKEALSVLQSPTASNKNKAFHLRILIHVIGDIHQPLHAINVISHSFPKGDLGGNLFVLGKNPVGRNLHQYWDRGGGFLLGGSSLKKARQLEARWACNQDNLPEDPKEWIDSSHQLAIQEAYSIGPGTIPNEKYSVNTQNISQRQLFFAGCRLAALLNKVLS